MRKEWNNILVNTRILFHELYGQLIYCPHIWMRNSGRRRDDDALFKEEEIIRNRTRQGKNNRKNKGKIIMNLVCLTKTTTTEPPLFLVLFIKILLLEWLFVKVSSLFVFFILYHFHVIFLYPFFCLMYCVSIRIKDNVHSWSNIILILLKIT